MRKRHRLFYPAFPAAAEYKSPPHMGGHIRTGMEYTLYLNRGVLAKSIGELCEKAVKMIRGMGFEAATPEETRKILGTKGADQVGF